VVNKQSKKYMKQDNPNNACETEAGWCCACAADIALLNKKIKDARDEMKSEILKIIDIAEKGELDWEDMYEGIREFLN